MESIRIVYASLFSMLAFATVSHEARAQTCTVPSGGCTSQSGTGATVLGTATTVYGVEGTSSSGDGVYGSSASANGVVGTVSSSTTGAAVLALSNGATEPAVGAGGVSVWGISGNDNTAVYGLSQATTGGSAIIGALSSTDTTGKAVFGYAPGLGSSYAGYFTGNVHVTGTLTCGSGCTSDLRLKKNVTPLTGAIDRLLALKGINFEWIDPAAHNNDAGPQMGFIAQDVEKVFPNWVNDKGYQAPDGQNYRTLDLRQIEALEVESIRTLRIENDELGDRVKVLEAGRRPLASGFGENGVGLGMAAIAGAIVFGSFRRRRSEG